ncbi:MAG: hypothetical protein WAU81_01705 [Candidatus Aminicenantales bacterium]
MFLKLRSFALKHFETTLILIVLFGIVAVAFLVHYKFAFLNFFFLPVILAGYYLGKKQAVLTASLCILLVALYHIFSRVLFRLLPPISLDEILNIVTWAGFLILTAAIIGIITEQREARMKSLQRAYTGVLEIILKYLEVADERKPRSVRVAHLAGKIAEAAGLSTCQVENIKSAALLIEAGDLRSNLHLYEQVAVFIENESGLAGKQVDSRARVLLRTTASLLKEVEPILANYFYHYVEEAAIIDKDLSTVPLGSSIIALADLCDRFNTAMLGAPWKDKIRSLQDIRLLSGRAFQTTAVQALFKVLSPPV